VNGDVDMQDCDDDDPLYGLLDINTATAEELMTLPYINRASANNVVTYRAHIGGFRKVEDMALVPGVGATRFGHLRSEIYVADALPPPTTLRRSGSSATSSGIDVSLTPVDSVSRDFMTTTVSGTQTSSSAWNTHEDCDGDTYVNSRAADADNGYPVLVMSGDVTTRLEPLQRRCPRQWPEDSGMVRVATWNLWPYSADMSDVNVRQLVALTLHEKWQVSVWLMITAHLTRTRVLPNDPHPADGSRILQ